MRLRGYVRVGLILALAVSLAAADSAPPAGAGSRRDLLEGLKRLEKGLGFHRTKNFRKFSNKPAAAYRCYYTGKLELPDSYEGLKLAPGTRDGCAVDGRKYDVFFYPLDAVPYRKAPVSASLARESTERFLVVVPHEDFHENRELRKLPAALNEPAATLMGFLTGAEMARQKFGAASEVSRNLAREPEIFLRKSAIVNRYYDRLSELYAAANSGRISRAEALARKGELLEELRQACEGLLPDPKSFNKCPAAINNAGLAFDHTYTKYYPVMYRIDVAYGGNAEEIAGALQQALNTKSEAEALERLRDLTNEISAAPAAVPADGAPHGTMKLYVTNSLGDDITIIDLATFKPVGDIKVGEHVHGVCAPADGRRLFATIESEDDLKVIDTATDKVVETVRLTGRPNQCASTPDGRFVGVPIRDRNSVDIVDTTQKRVVKVLPVRVPHNCYDADNNQEMFVSSMGSHEIDLIDLKSLEYVEKIPVGGIPRPYAVSKDGRRAYVALTDLHGFVIVSLPERKVIARVDLPPAPPLACPLEPRTPTHGLELSPDGKELWVTSLADGGVYVYDIATRKISKEIPVGACPNWITFSPDGRYCAVSNSASDDCSIIDTETRCEVARVKVGRGPKRLLAINVP